MLDQCPACEGKVSSAAAACPHCGHPIGEATDRVRSERVVTTQESGKDVKVLLLIGAVAMILSPFVGVLGNEPLGWFVFAGGLGMWFIGRVSQWWDYG